MSVARILIHARASALCFLVGATLCCLSAQAATLQGDCNGSGVVAIHELQRCVNIFIGAQPLGVCPACDQNADGAVDIAEVQGAGRCFRNPSAASCSMITPHATSVPAATPTSPPTATTVAAATSTAAPPPTQSSSPTATVTATATPTAPQPTPTATAGLALCGNGVVEPPETCDDGNTRTADACPPDCVIRSCVPDGTTRPADVTFRSPTSLVSITVFVDYPDGTLQIPGTGTASTVGQRITNRPGGFLATFVDFDHGLRGTLSGASPLTNPRLFTINFDRCQDAPPASVADFDCTVLEAANQMFQPVAGVTCSVSLP